MEKRFLDNSGLNVYDSEIKDYIGKQITDALVDIVVQEDSMYKFPSVGKENAIYIDTTTEKIYRWSDDGLKYYVIFDNYDSLKSTYAKIEHHHDDRYYTVSEIDLAFKDALDEATFIVCMNKMINAVKEYNARIKKYIDDSVNGLRTELENIKYIDGNF